MYVTKEKIIKIFFIVVTICIVLAIGFFLTGKTPEELFAEKKEKESFDTNISGVTLLGRPAITYSALNETVYTFTDTVNPNKMTFANTSTPFYIHVMAKGGGGDGETKDVSNILIARKTTISIRLGKGNTLDASSSTVATFQSYDSDGNLIPSNIPTIIAEGSGSRDEGGTFVVYVPPITDPDASGNEYDETKYNRNNLDITYHGDADVSDVSFGSITVLDKNGKKVTIPYVPGAALPTYYHPGSLRYGSKNYVPTYEDSVYLSRITGTNGIYFAQDSASQKAGFCNQPFSSDIEKKCKALDPNVCASVSCCVLLGGNKCVAGDEKGPVMKSNYADPFIVNKDVYYYQGKCYGNCV